MYRKMYRSPTLSRSGLRFISSLCFLNLSLLSDSPPLFLPWRRRLGERRRHLSRLRSALCRRRASSRCQLSRQLRVFSSRRHVVLLLLQGARGEGGDGGAQERPGDPRDTPLGRPVPQHQAREHSSC